MNINNNNLSDIFAQAKAIHYAMKNGAISYEKAKILTKPLLGEINRKAAKIAKKFNKKPTKITFYDLGRTL